VHAAFITTVHAGRLPEDRVAQAASRVRALARTTAGRMPAPGTGPDTTTAPLPDATVAGAFRVDGRATAWLAAPGPVAFVQVASTANLAVGDVSWGPAALGVTVAEADVPPGARVAVVGRAVEASHPAAEVVHRLRGAGHDVVLVECGWPRGGADIETFGGSPAVARALVALCRGEVAP